MLHNFEINALEAQLARQARISNVVLTLSSALAVVVVLTQVLGVLSI
ncbi:hypothetical protein [Microvirga zambiensis]|nr:hypothetical protein [Microvirga zambiensis]